MAGKSKAKGKIKRGVWKRIRSRVEAGMTLAQAAREHGVSRSAVSRRANKEGWKRPQRAAVSPKPKEAAAACARVGGKDQAAALKACEQAVTRALLRAAEGLMQAETDISKAMEPVDKALKLKRELAKENREHGNTTVVVETVVPEPSSEPSSEQTPHRSP